VWNSQALDGAGYIPATKLKLIEAAAVKACDGHDGVIEDPSKCHFDPAVLECKGEASDSCLTEAQVGALKKIYAGPKKFEGRTAFPGVRAGWRNGLGGWDRGSPDFQRAKASNWRSRMDFSPT